MKKASAEQLNQLKEAVASLTDIDFSDTAAVEVQLDAVASAFLNLKRVRRSLVKKKEPPSLANVLARFVEDDEIVAPSAVSLVDEIDNLIRTKDYEGYSDDYVAECLEALLTNLQDELESTIKKLETKSGQ